MQNLNTFRKIVFSNGESAELTLQFYALYQISQKFPELYENYSKSVGQSDEVSLLWIIYTGYVCAAVLRGKEFLAFDNFLNLLPENHALLMPLAADLLYGKKKQAETN